MKTEPINLELLYALEALANQIRAHHPMNNVRKDFSLMNAEAFARKVIAKAKGQAQ